MSPASSPFDVLGLPETATPEEARRAYRRLAFRHHPDRNPGDPAAAEAFLAAKEAFERIAAAGPDDGGYDADRVVAEVQRAAAEAERRRGRAGGPGRAWQQVRVALTRPLSRRLRDAVVSRPALVGLGAVAAVALGLAVGGVVPAGAAALVASVVGGGAVAHAVRTSVDESWAVETHWQGLRDLRWDVLVSWSEICAAREATGALDLVLTDGAARRLARLVPAHALPEPAVYRLPLTDAARLAVVVRAHMVGCTKSG
ncbi:J domain-containing protein [Rubrivirga sp.]|uniref:J domain-containing protein n=1 Tax=Rubrivirga sp. TaxID=1885344 RepID=UPI003B52A605